MKTRRSSLGTGCWVFSFIWKPHPTRPGSLSNTAGES